METTTQKRQFKYRGKELEELKALDTREVTKYLGSRARRTILRNFQEIEDFIKRAKEKEAKGKKIRTHKRKLIVVPQMVGMQIHIHNGRAFIQVDIVPEMIGHYFGEFAVTRGKVSHSKSGAGATKGSKAKSKK
jgi:small subunit ribosomal protein S19